MVKTIYTEEYKKFTESLKKARIEVGLTQVEVAKKIGMSQSYVSKIENGEQRADVIELKVFAELFKKDINYFI